MEGTFSIGIGEGSARRLCDATVDQRGASGRADDFLQLLSRMGGLGVFDDRKNIRVVRRDGDKITEYIVDYDAIIKGDLKQDILLRPGDRIIVP